jgi:hypothetical protein
MPFCPSFEPCANDTPVQVRISRPRIHAGSGRSEVGVERLVADHQLHHQQHERCEDEAHPWTEQERAEHAHGL